MQKRKHRERQLQRQHNLAQGQKISDATVAPQSDDKNGGKDSEASGNKTPHAGPRRTAYWPAPFPEAEPKSSTRRESSRSPPGSGSFVLRQRQHFLCQRTRWPREQGSQHLRRRQSTTRRSNRSC